MTGLITDVSKAAVAGANVDLTNEDTKVTRSSTTNGDSVYRFDAVTSVAATNLPLTNQNPVQLVLTMPGVSSNRYSFGTGTFPVNGARAQSNNFLIDGTENNDISVTGQAFQITNPDAVQEVSAQTSNFDSEYGRAGGGVINVITKSAGRMASTEQHDITWNRRSSMG